jgi:hypothetical protein
MQPGVIDCSDRLRAASAGAPSSSSGFLLLPALLPAGDWHSDMRQGKGTCLFASGDKYQGVFKCRHLVGVVQLELQQHPGSADTHTHSPSQADPHPLLLLQASGRQISGTDMECADLPTGASFEVRWLAVLVSIYARQLMPVDCSATR